MEPDDRINFKCQHCKAEVRAKRKVAGLTRQCPGCSLPIVVPLPTPEPYVPPPVDADALRGLSFLAVRAATLVQDTITSDKHAAMLINNIFVYLPHEYELDSIGTRWNDSLEKAWLICKDVKATIDRYGGQHRDAWLECLGQMRILDTTVTREGSRIARRKWSIATRRSVWNRYGRRCIHCGLELQTWQGSDMHLDHLIPLCDNGPDDESNLVPACPDCNLEKGASRYPEIENPRKTP